MHIYWKNRGNFHSVIAIFKFRFLLIFARPGGLDLKVGGMLGKNYLV